MRAGGYGDTLANMGLDFSAGAWALGAGAAKGLANFIASEVPRGVRFAAPWVIALAVADWGLEQSEEGGALKGKYLPSQPPPAC